MPIPSIDLTDDGTMDTVLRCSGCGAEMRYNYTADDPSTGDDPTDHRTDAQRYRDFVDWAIEDAENEHVCGDEEAA